MRQAVLATLAYYDVLDFPLTAEEVFQYLVRLPDHTIAREELTLSETQKTLDQLLLEKVVGREGEYYFLDEREHLVPFRLKKAKISARKLRHARRISWWLRFFPHIEAIFASGSLGLGNCDELSDLDVLVVAKHGRIWLARFFITVWLSCWSLRRQPWHKLAPDKICLNHYITDQSLAIPFHNLYNAQTYIHFQPLLVRDQRIVSRFYEANPWLGDYLYHGAPQSYDIMIYHKNWLAGFFEWLLNNPCGAWLERQTRQYQIKRIEQNPLTRHPTGHVIYDDDQLSFHPASPETAVMQKYQARLTQAGF